MEQGLFGRLYPPTSLDQLPNVLFFNALQFENERRLAPKKDLKIARLRDLAEATCIVQQRDHRRMPQWFIGAPKWHLFRTLPEHAHVR